MCDQKVNRNPNAPDGDWGEEVETGGVDEVETGGTNEEVQILSSSSKSEFVRIFFLLKSLKEYSFLSFRKIDEGVAH